MIAYLVYLIDDGELQVLKTFIDKTNAEEYVEYLEANWIENKSVELKELVVYE